MLKFQVRWQQDCNHLFIQLQACLHVTLLQRALLRTAQEVAKGMDYIHSFGIIHGDLKLGNVLLKTHRVDRRGYVAKVSDFGKCILSLFLLHWQTSANLLHSSSPSSFLSHASGQVRIQCAEQRCVVGVTAQKL